MSMCVRSRFVVAALLLIPAAVSAAPVSIAVDAGKPHQTIEGFGATTISLVFGATDNVPAALRAKAIDAAYNQVRLNMGNLEVGPFESPASALYSPANDDSDPKTFNAAGFNWTQSDNMKSKIVDLAAPFGFDNYWIGPAISEGYEFAWAKALRTSNYDRYLDECAEHVAALAIHWRDAYRVTPRFLQLWNEPLSGNSELSGGSTQELVDIVKRAGARLRAEGFDKMTFVVPAEETEDVSLSHAKAILDDPAARPYVGAIAYHPYPYGSVYASVPNILATSGTGKPDPGRIAVRNSLRDLGARYGVPVMMIEVSHSDVPFGNFDGTRGRAIQIHDEMVHADAAAFFGMNAIWDSVTQAQHYAGRQDPGLFSETDTIVLVDVAAAKVYITEMGRAIGHYARFVPRGSVRIDGSSDDPLVQVTAFRDAKNARLVLVAINNASATRTLAVSVAGLSLEGTVTGEQSTAAAAWAPLPAVTARAAGFGADVPALSVTTFAAKLAAGSGPDAGADAGGRDAPLDSPRPSDAGSADGARGGDGAAGQTGGADAAASGGRGGSSATGGSGGSDAGRPSGGTGGGAPGSQGAADGGESATDAGRQKAAGSGCSCGVGRRRTGGPAVPWLLVVGLMCLGFRRRQRCSIHSSMSGRAYAVGLLALWHVASCAKQHTADDAATAVSMDGSRDETTTPIADAGGAPGNASDALPLSGAVADGAPEARILMDCRPRYEDVGEFSSHCQYVGAPTPEMVCPQLAMPVSVGSLRITVTHPDRVVPGRPVTLDGPDSDVTIGAAYASSRILIQTRPGASATGVLVFDEFRPGEIMKGRFVDVRVSAQPDPVFSCRIADGSFVADWGPGVRDR
jgi:O-glycosyl hydrolase